MVDKLGQPHIKGTLQIQICISGSLKLVQSDMLNISIVSQSIEKVIENR